MGSLLKAALTLWAHVCLEERLRARSHISFQLSSLLAFIQGFLRIFLGASLLFFYILLLFS